MTTKMTMKVTTMTAKASNSRRKKNRSKDRFGEKDAEMGRGTRDSLRLMGRFDDDEDEEGECDGYRLRNWELSWPYARGKNTHNTGSGVLSNRG